jgi:hypothetical protein
VRNLHASSTFWKCPHCGSAMKIVERFTVTQIQLRALHLFSTELPHEPPTPTRRTHVLWHEAVLLRLAAIRSVHSRWSPKTSSESRQGPTTPEAT